MHACILCKSSHFAKTFGMSLPEKSYWLDLGDTTKNKFDNNENLYNCGFFLELHMDRFHRKMWDFVTHPKNKHYIDLMEILLKRDHQKKLGLDKFLELSFLEQKTFLLPNLKGCIPVAQYDRSTFLVEEGIEAATNLFEDLVKDTPTYDKDEGYFSLCPKVDSLRKVVTVLSGCPGSFGLTNKEGEEAHLVCCFCTGFMAHMYDLIEPVCGSHLAFKKLKRSNTCDIYYSKEKFIEHLKEEGKKDIYHRLYFE